MEHIRHAIERSKAEDALRARARPVEKLVVSVTPGTESVDRAVSAGGPHGDVTASRFERLELKPRHLQANRIIAHDTADPRTKSFDMLRTQVLQTMDAKKWRFLAVTSPSPGCGKTVTAINLALSIARRPDRSVLLVDLDLNKPKIADRLGVKRSQGVVGVLQGHTRLEDAVFEARVGDCRMCVMPSETTLPRSAEWMASRQMTDLLHSISRTSDFGTIILDLPPMLASDDVITILPQLDCVLLVASVGTSTAAELKECSKHLQSSDVVRVVVNKVDASEAVAGYY
jgi:Mrp family chromosome partitioning ATPase